MQDTIGGQFLSGTRINRRSVLTALGSTAGLTMATAAGAAARRADSPGTVRLVEFDASGKRTGVVTVEKIVKSDAEWKKQLTREEYEITRREGTERAFTGKTWNNHEPGLYRCVCCGTALFSSDTKFESGTGWPSFWEPIAQENVITHTDSSYGMVRTEVKCARCEAHLGHVFDDGPKPTHLRYCMNSGAMTFEKKVG